MREHDQLARLGQFVNCQVAIRVTIGSVGRVGVVWAFATRGASVDGGVVRRCRREEAQGDAG